jgi:MoxR-like ATPase
MKYVAQRGETVEGWLDTLVRLGELEATVGGVLRGKAEVVRLSLVCLLARGHLLMEDVPGVGKTTLAQALARAVDCGFQRLQFTSDMLPSDVLGVTIYNAHARPSSSSPARFSPISCWPTKSTAPRPKRNRRCSRP